MTDSLDLPEMFKGHPFIKFFIVLALGAIIGMLFVFSMRPDTTQNRVDLRFYSCIADTVAWSLETYYPEMLFEAKVYCEAQA